MYKSEFLITKMDCPSEESLIRMALSEMHDDVKHLDFDLSERKLTVYHQNEVSAIEEIIQGLNLGDSHLRTEKSDETFEDQKVQKRLLWIVLLINLSFFFIEVVFGWISKSMGLVADSLDMLADSIVYGLSIYAVGSTTQNKKFIAKIAGYLQIILASLGGLEVLRRFIGVENLPNSTIMISVSCLALLANVASLLILQKAKSEEAHMKASMIFTSNDIIINTGVILAAVIVGITASNIPDLVIGAIVFALVIQGAFRILKLSK